MCIRDRRSADDRHLRRGDLREDLAAGGARLGERTVRAAEDVPKLDDPLLGVLTHRQHRVDLPAHVLQGARLTVVHRRVRPTAARRRTALGRDPERQRVRHDLRAQLRQRARDAFQVVARRVLAGAHADRVREPAGALEFGRQQVDPGRQRRPDRVRGDHHVQARGVQLVHPVDERGERVALAELVRSAVERRGVGRRGGAARDRDGLAAEQLRQLHQVLAAGPAAAGPDLAGGAQRVRVRVEVRPQQRDRRLRRRPALPGDTGELGALQESAARVVLEGEERGLYRLVLRAEPRQRTVHLVPVHHRPGGSRDAHRSPLAAVVPVGGSVRPVLQVLRRYSGAGGSDFFASLPSVADSHLSYDACQPFAVSPR